MIYSYEKLKSVKAATGPGKVEEQIHQALRSENWKTKFTALNLLKKIAKDISPRLSLLLPELIPLVRDCMFDSKSELILFFILILLFYI